MEAGNGARSAYLARQRIFGAVVKLADGVAVETLFVHFEHGPEQQDRRHFFDREPDRFRGRIEAAIAGWAITLLAPAGKQLCRRLIVEAGHAVFKHSRAGKASQPRPQALRQTRPRSGQTPHAGTALVPRRVTANVRQTGTRSGGTACCDRAGGRRSRRSWACSWSPRRLRRSSRR